MAELRGGPKRLLVVDHQSLTAASPEARRNATARRGDPVLRQVRRGEPGTDGRLSSVGSCATVKLLPISCRPSSVMRILLGNVSWASITPYPSADAEG